VEGEGGGERGGDGRVDACDDEGVGGGRKAPPGAPHTMGMGRSQLVLQLANTLLSK